MEQKENPCIGVKTSGETNTPPSWLAQFAQVRLGGEETKKRKPRLRLLFYGWPTLMPEGCTILCLLNETLSCNRAVTLVHHFKYLLWQDRTKEITHSPDISYHDVWELIKSPIESPIESPNRKSNRKVLCSFHLRETCLDCWHFEHCRTANITSSHHSMSLKCAYRKQHMYDFLQRFLGW